jgi:recombinational DNA repair ATPase RecF
MRIVELIIDGFKSYAVRTVISGWDDSFNSITGLNGSGKSNILDAICFCLGITTMQVVRAQNLQVGTCYSMFCAFPDCITIGSDLQTWTSWSHQSQRHNRVR